MLTDEGNSFVMVGMNEVLQQLVHALEIIDQQVLGTALIRVRYSRWAEAGNDRQIPGNFPGWRGRDKRVPGNDPINIIGADQVVKDGLRPVLKILACDIYKVESTFLSGLVDAAPELPLFITENASRRTTKKSNGSP